VLALIVDLVEQFPNCMHRIGAGTKELCTSSMSSGTGRGKQRRRCKLSREFPYTEMCLITWLVRSPWADKKKRPSDFVYRYTLGPQSMVCALACGGQIDPVIFARRSRTHKCYRKHGNFMTQGLRVPDVNKTFHRLV